ncbi:MAG: hypothetical protein U0Q16_38075 [Bryobacteraceae bacterium]
MLTISPPKVSLAAGQTQAFSATDQNGAAVKPTWSISPALASIDSNGVCTAPPAVSQLAELKVSAALNDDSGEASVTLSPSALKIIPDRVTLRGAETQTFRALIGGVEAPSLVWTISPELGTFDKGRYTAPVEIKQGRTVRIIAAGRGGDGAEATISLIPPQPAWWIRASLGAYLMLIFALTLAIAQLISPLGAAGASPVNVPVFGSLSRDMALIWIVLLSGALGAFVYSAKSFVSYLGNESFKASWTAWYLMMPGIGAGLALVFYLVFRGGFLSGVSDSSSVNPYGFAAVSAMVGMFTKQATNKLDETFSTLFRTATPPDLKDRLPEAEGSKPSTQGAQAPPVVPQATPATQQPAPATGQDAPSGQQAMTKSAGA